MSEEKYGFVYIWRDRKKHRYYVGSHWGREDDGYICSSNWMYNTYKRRPEDFKRRIISRIYTTREDLLIEEQRWINMMKPSELAAFNSSTKKRETVRYYNFNISVKKAWYYNDESRSLIGKKISAAKTGKSVPCTTEKAAAISAAKKGKSLTEAHKEALRGIKKKPHTDEWKAANSERMKRQWADGTRKR